MAAPLENGMAAHVGVVPPTVGEPVTTELTEAIGLNQSLNDVSVRWSYHVNETLGSGAFGVVW